MRKAEVHWAYQERQGRMPKSHERPDLLMYCVCTVSAPLTEDRADEGENVVDRFPSRRFGFDAGVMVGNGGWMGDDNWCGKGGEAVWPMRRQDRCSIDGLVGVGRWWTGRRRVMVVMVVMAVMVVLWWCYGA